MLFTKPPKTAAPVRLWHRFPTGTTGLKIHECSHREYPAMSKEDLPSRLAALVTQRNLFGRHDRIVVGVSGGADSMALLHALHELNQQEGWSLALHVAHLNHRLR